MGLPLLAKGVTNSWGRAVMPNVLNNDFTGIDGEWGSVLPEEVVWNDARDTSWQCDGLGMRDNRL
eukprot:scaffold176200_cov16-Tisochrysis_lutea.AAC.1